MSPSHKPKWNISRYFLADEEQLVYILSHDLFLNPVTFFNLSSVRASHEIHEKWLRCTLSRRCSKHCVCIPDPPPPPPTHTPQRKKNPQRPSLPDTQSFLEESYYPTPHGRVMRLRQKRLRREADNGPGYFRFYLIKDLTAWCNVCTLGTTRIGRKL